MAPLAIGAILQEYKKPIVIFTAAATIGTILVVIIILLRRKFGKDTARRNAEREERQLDQLISASVDRGAIPPILTDTQIDTIATNIHSALVGWGTDNDLLIDSIKSIPTAADYLKVKAAFARLAQTENWYFTDGNMAVDIRDDVNVGSDTDNHIMRHLATIGITQL